MLIELYNGFGVFGAGITTGTYTLTGDELDYATCGVCVRLYTEADPDDGYLATGGTVTVTALSPNLVVDLSDLTFEHVTIDPTTFASTPHADSCTSTMTSAPFDVLPTLWLPRSRYSIAHRVGGTWITVPPSSIHAAPLWSEPPRVGITRTIAEKICAGSRGLTCKMSVSSERS